MERILLSLLAVFVFVFPIIFCEGFNKTESDSKLTNSQITELLNKMLGDMDHRVRPNVDNGSVLVHIGIYVASFGSISATDMDYTMSMFLYHTWYDSRLEYKSTRDHITVSAHVLDQLWTPDLYFPTEKEANYHDVTFRNRLMRISPDGRVSYVLRLTVKMACPMDLQNYPMDEQECEFMLESFTADVRELAIEWQDPDAIIIKDDLELPQFDLLNITTPFCEDQPYKAGNFSCLKARTRLRRQFGYFLLQTYIPSILIVMISWISFWINMDAVPARISLGVTTVLTMATQLSGSMYSIPNISYPKAIDVWVVTCMTFVFAALIEYAFVNAMSQRRGPMAKKPLTHSKSTMTTAPQGDTQKVRNRKNTVYTLEDIIPQISGDTGIECYGAPDNNKQTENRQEEEKLHRSWRHCALQIDRTCKVLFPLLFIGFNGAYWGYYTRTRTT